MSGVHVDIFEREMCVQAIEESITKMAFDNIGPSYTEEDYHHWIDLLAKFDEDRAEYWREELKTDPNINVRK